jgi:hypothetical protein
MNTLLHDLLELETFASGAEACIYEADLWARYGKSETITAIETGLIEHRRIKFRDGHGRCVCWLSDKGKTVAKTEQEASSVL